MLDVMKQAKNAIEAYNSALKVTSANIANMSTVGYKRLDISFDALFNRILTQGTAAGTFDNLGGTNPTQLGQGTAIASLDVDFSQGDLSGGSHLDLAISGQGFFIVSEDGGTTYKYTRAGQFSLDSSGNLVTASGAQVYGFYGSSTTLMPITGISSATYTLENLSFSTAGSLLEYTDNTYATVKADTGWRVALTYFPNPSGLLQSSGTAFEQTAASGDAQTPALPGGAAGTISVRSFEESNVVYLAETIDAMEYQRVMNGNLTMVRMASDIIQNFINSLS